tara:strand:+ start:19350 stop:20087 length:738 start_codon:yes stop_codon:yes gene_type:complete
VGDISEGSIKIVKKINLISIPAYVILGNHDRGKDKSGETLVKQIRILNEKYCAWDLKVFNNEINILSGRPCSSGGGYYLSREVLGVYGPLTEEDSVKKIMNSYKKSRNDLPLLIISHAGPSGLGSDPNSICGRDWKIPSLDWGDRDLSTAIRKIQKERFVDLVIFGHMHNKLNRNLGTREMFITDKKGTFYLNAAIVPRYHKDFNGIISANFSWVEFENKKISHISQRWFTPNGKIKKENILFEI